MQETKKVRLHLIDEYRGFVVLNMIVYHAIWDLVYIYGVDMQWYKSDMTFIWQQWGCWSFILVSGFCWQMSKKPLKRGLMVFGGGLLVSLVTILVMPSSRVMFGVLTFLGSAMILMMPIDLVCKKINALLGAIGSFLLFAFTYSINRGYFGFFKIEILELPDAWYANLFTTYLGMSEPGFFSTDYFSLFPWLFLYICGYFCYNLVFKSGAKSETKTVPTIMQKSVCPPLGWIGRKSFIIYLLHQPVTYAVLMLWDFLK